MHLDVPIPADLSIYASGEGAGAEGWAKCFATLAETEAACRAAGFDILEAAYAPEAWAWWDEFSRNDPFCKANPRW